MAAKKDFYGVTDEQELKPGSQTKDHRSINQKWNDWLHTKQNMGTILFFCAMLIFIFPDIQSWIFLLASFLTIKALLKKDKVPLKMPIQANVIDPKELGPKRVPQRANGIFFIGNDMKTGKEIWLTNSDCRQHFLVLGTTGAGKALPNNTNVLTPKGWFPIESLKTNDLVITPDGKSAKIRGVYPQGSLKLQRIHFQNSLHLDVSSDHLWEVFNKKEDKEVRSILSTNDILEEYIKNKEALFSIRITEPIEYEEQKLIINPYLFGLFLNEEDPDSFIDHWSSECKLLGISEPERRIPNSYKFSSIHQRWNLVHGLMDHSGYFIDTIGVNHCLNYESKNEILIKDFQDIIRSLGGIVDCKENNGIYKLYIKHSHPELFFNRSYEKDKVLSFYKKKTINRLAILKVEDILVEKECTCILVDHVDHLFITENYLVTHNTEALIGFGANALSWGSGFLFCDGKGDVSVFSKVYALARRFGREDDLLVLNFMNGGADVTSMMHNTRITSNTLNPFSNGSADGLTQMVVSLMDDAGGDGGMWKGRAEAMLTGIVRALCWLRDNGIIDLNVGELRSYMNIKKIISLSDEKQFPDLPADIRTAIRGYLTSLPGFQEDKGERQASTTLEQHGFLEMQFTRILGSLADVYGHIFKTPYGEVDMHDVVLNRRILFIMLPALEKSGSEIANLGKIIVANLRGMMGGTLGNSIEGTWEDVVDKRPTSASSPFLVILDEVGYYTVEGMALMAAQARSLGFAMVYASQDIPAMTRINEKESASIIANTNTKIFMRTEEADKTGELAIKSGDKVTRLRGQGFEKEKFGDFGSYLKDTGGATYDEVNKISFNDLKSQESGEMHVIHKTTVIRANSFYANPESSLETKNLKLRACYFIAVPRPPLDELLRNQKGPEITQKILAPDIFETLQKEAKIRFDALPDLLKNEDELAIAFNLFSKKESPQLENKLKPLETSCAILAILLNKLRKKMGDVAEEIINGFDNSNSLVIEDNDEDELDLDGEEIEDNDESGEDEDDIDAFLDPRRRQEIMRDMEKRRRDSGNDFGEDDGVSFGERNKNIQQRRTYKPVSTMGEINTDISHNVRIDDKKTIDMADDLAANDIILNTLSAMDFDPNETFSEDLDIKINKVISGLDTPPDEINNKDVVKVAEKLQVMSEKTGIEDFMDTNEIPEDNIKSETIKKKKENSGLVITDFLEDLLSDDD